MVMGEMLFEDISYLELLPPPPPPLLGGAKLFMQFWKRASWGTFMWSYMKFGSVVQKEMPLEDISYLELLQPLCSADQEHWRNFGRMHHEEQFSEIILNLDLWFRRKCRLKLISYLELWQPFWSTECNHVCDFGRWYRVAQFYEIILNLG